MSEDNRPMTDAQESALLGFRYASDHWAIRRGLRNRGMIDSKGFPTQKATEWVRSSRAMARMLEHLTRQNPGAEVVEADSQLLSYLMQGDERDRVDVYVYCGSQPLVVRNGNGQKPLAILHPFYRWQIEVARTAGRFLKYVPVIGHKGSYSYDLDRASLAARKGGPNEA